MTYDPIKRRRPVDPDGNHYILSEDTHFDLQMLCAALLGLSALCFTPPGDDGPDFGTDEAAPIFYLLGEFGGMLLAEIAFHVSRRDG